MVFPAAHGCAADRDGDERITSCGFTNPKRGRSGCAFDLATAVTEREGWAMGQTRDGTAVAPLPSATDVTKRGWTEPQATTNGRSAA